MNNLSRRGARSSAVPPVIVITIFTGFLLANSAFAAQGTKLEEVVVTAQKRAETLQEVPVTMQAFTGAQLENFGVSQVTDITRLSPNLNVVVQNAMSQHIVIRGVGTNEFFGNAPSSVGMYMDEVTMNSSYMSTLGLFDMERVEILRGPQNSLFGRNTTGGAVNYISRLPVAGEPLSGYASALYGSHDRIEFEGAVSVPMGETAAARLAGKYHTRNGRWNDITKPDGSYGDSDRYSLRGTAIWEPLADTTVTGSFHVAIDHSQAAAQKAFGTLNNNPPLRLNDERTIFGPFYTSDIGFDQAVNEVQSQGINVATTDWGKVRTGGSMAADLKVYGGYIKIVHDFGPATLTSISAYDYTHALYEEDNGVSGLSSGPTGTGLNQEALLIDMDQEYKQFSQELRLASSDNSARLRWITGLYYFTQDSTLAQSIRFGTNGVLGFHPIINGVPPSVFSFPDTPAGFLAALDAIPNPYGNTASFSIHKLEDDSYSAYGQVDYDFTERWTLTAGLRYTHDQKSDKSFLGGAVDITGIPQSRYYDKALIQQLSAGLPGCPGAPLFFSGNCADLDTTRPDIKANELGGKIGLKYHVTDNIMVYASYSRGFKSGKFDVEFLHTIDTPFPQRSLDVEILDVYEVGMKSELLQDRMQFNAAFFHNTWTDQQVFNVGANGPEFINLPESRIIGMEADLKWVPMETWLVSASLGWLDTKITDATGVDFDLGQGEFQKGHELPLAPSITANGVIIKDIAIMDNVLTLQLDARYQSSSKVKYKPSYPIDEYPSRFEMNARASYVFGAKQQYQVSAFLNNITSAKYCVEKQDLHALVGAYYCVPNDGEMQFGLQGKISF